MYNVNTKYFTTAKNTLMRNHNSQNFGYYSSYQSLFQFIDTNMFPCLTPKIILLLSVDPEPLVHEIYIGPIKQAVKKAQNPYIDGMPTDIKHQISLSKSSHTEHCTHGINIHAIYQAVRQAHNTYTDSLIPPIAAYNPSKIILLKNHRDLPDFNVNILQPIINSAEEQTEPTKSKDTSQNSNNPSYEPSIKEQADCEINMSHYV